MQREVLFAALFELMFSNRFCISALFRNFATFFKKCKNMKVSKAKYLLMAAVVCLLAIFGFGYYFFLTAFSTSSEKQHIYIDDDDNLDSVVIKLRPIGTEHAITGFSTLIRHTSYADNPHTGHYIIEPGETTWAVMQKLRHGQQQAVMLTIPESKTMDRLAGVLGKKLMLDSVQIAEALIDEIYCHEWGYDTASISALFVPNTYEVYWNISLDHLMKRMVKEHDAFWTAERMRKAEAAGLTPNEVATLASIVDEETANTEEKPMIAGMYLNRLHMGMPLQADPTVKFAMKNFELRRIYHDMLFFDSPYNTYRNTGLPPGPIKIASVKGIEAVLNYAKHNYLYMCAKEDFSGTHNFASSYSEHLRNAARYAKALNERGIK